VSWNDIEKLQTRFEKTEWDEIAIILARIALIPSVMVTVFCGVMRIPPKKYAIITFIGGFLKALYVALLGWWAGELYVRYAGYIDTTEKLLLIVIILCVIGFVIYRKKVKKVLVYENKNIE
jgi:membrane protein DedA with SNARE-associated domain